MRRKTIVSVSGSRYDNVRCHAVRAGLTLATLTALSAAAHATPVGTLADSNGHAVAWGVNDFGQATVAAGAFTAVSGGSKHTLAIRADGTLTGWGHSGNGELAVPSGTFTAVAAGFYVGLGIRSNGTLAGWGYQGDFVPFVPPGTYTAVAAGDQHAVALQTDGTLVAWGGDNLYGEQRVPAGTFTAIAAGGFHSLAIRTNGTLAGWGLNLSGQRTVPAGTYTAVAAGWFHSLAIRTDGTLVAWGGDTDGSTVVPAGTFTAIAAGQYYSLGLRSDGTLAGWGKNDNGETNVPAGIYVSVAAGSNHGLALEARTAYDGDLAVSGTGLTANLNRPVTVAGRTSVASLMHLYHNPTLTSLGDITVSPGGGIQGSGALAAPNISLAPGSQILLDLGPTAYDHLSLSGNLALAGTLKLSLLDGFTPAPGASFDLLDFPSHTGQFDALDLPLLTPGLAWDTSALYSTGTLSITAVPEPASLSSLALATLATLSHRRSRPRTAE